MNMSLDGPASATVLPLSRRVLSIPRTSLGKWSMWLLAAFVRKRQTNPSVPAMNLMMK